MLVESARQRPSKWPPILFVCFIAAALGACYKLLYDPTVRLKPGFDPNGMLFAADGSALALSGWSDLELYSVPGYDRIGRIEVPRAAIGRPAFAWSANLSHVALSVGTGTSIEIRDARSNAYFRSLPSDAPGEIILEEDSTGRTSTYGPELVEQMAWSPDGRYLAIMRHSGAVQVWDLQTNETISVASNVRSNESCLAWSADSQMLMFNSQNWGALSIYSPPDFATARTFESEERCSQLAFNPNGTLLALYADRMDDNAIEVWHLGTMLRTATRPARVDALAWHPSEEVLAILTHGRLELWRPFDDEVALLAEADEFPFLAMAFTPDGRDILIATGDGRVRSWPLAEHAPGMFK